MDSFSELAKNRRSIRNFGPQPVEFDKIMELIHAGSYAPSVGNLQPWQFIIITDDGVKERLVAACPQQEWMHSAPILLVITSDVGKVTDFYGDFADRWCSQTCAAVVENMLLSAVDIGIGACWVGSFDSENFREILRVPDGFRPEACIAIGYSDEVPEDKNIRPLDQCTFFNAFGGKLESTHSWLRDWGELAREKVSKTQKRYDTRTKKTREEFGGRAKDKTDELKQKLKGFFKK